MKITNQIREIDFHLLDLRYSHTRIQNDKTLVSLQNSIQSYGQIVPVLAVAELEKYVLIDGYKRLLALKACGHDSINLQLLCAEASESLFLLLAQNNERKLEAIEQAALIQELQSLTSTLPADSPVSDIPATEEKAIDNSPCKALMVI